MGQQHFPQRSHAQSCNWTRKPCFSVTSFIGQWMAMEKHGKTTKDPFTAAARLLLLFDFEAQRLPNINWHWWRSRSDGFQSPVVQFRVLLRGSFGKNENVLLLGQGTLEPMNNARQLKHSSILGCEKWKSQEL